MNLTTMRYFARKLEQVRAILRGSGSSREDAIVSQWCSVLNKSHLTGPSVHQVLSSSHHKQFLRSRYRNDHLLSSLTKPTRLPVRCSCQPSAVSVRKNCTTTSKRTPKLTYSSSQRHPCGRHRGISTRCSCIWASTFPSKSGEKNTST